MTLILVVIDKLPETWIFPGILSNHSLELSIEVPKQLFGIVDWEFLKAIIVILN